VWRWSEPLASEILVDGAADFSQAYFLQDYEGCNGSARKSMASVRRVLQGGSGKGGVRKAMLSRY
jgi:hypothetical protein